MSRFADPILAIKYLAESKDTAPRTPNKITYRALSRLVGVHHTTIWRILTKKSVARRIVKEKLEELALSKQRKLRRR